MSNTHMYKGTSASFHMYKGSSASFHEEGAGGYFYAFSKELSTKTYTEVFSSIVLPTQLKVSAAIPRNAYISLGLQAKGTDGFDAGLCSTGKGWFPFYYDVLGKAWGSFEAYTSPSNAATASVVVKPIDDEHVHMYVQFLDANGKNVGTTFDRTFKAAKRENGWCGYYRFASLVPSSGNVSNNSDETYMIGGKFANNGIYNGSKYELWGINTNLCQVAWTEEFPKAQLLNINNYGEEFRIDHWA